MTLFAHKARNTIALLSTLVVAAGSLYAFGFDAGNLTAGATYQQPTRVQRKPIQGQVSKTGTLVPMLDTYSGRARDANLDSGVSDQGSLDSGVYNNAPLRGGAFDRAPHFSGATVDIGGTPMTTTSQLQLLSTRNVVILVDRSSSMNEKDCPGNVSRWRWCQEQAELFSGQIAGVLNERFTLGLFAHNYEIYPNVTVDQMGRLFGRKKLGLGTHPEGALREIFDSYFRGDMGQKPLAIAIVSDGDPNDEDKVAEVIKEATWQMRSPDQISITFLQVGHDEDGTDTLREFDQQLRRQGAKYDIVDRRSFYDVQRLGLLGSLVVAIKATTPAVVKTPARPKAKPKPASRPALRPALKPIWQR